VPDAARRARAACGRARGVGASPPGVRPLRRALVPVLVAAPAGEPGDGGHGRPRDRGSRLRAVVTRSGPTWRSAEGCRVTLSDGRELLDLSGGFGVAALGHRNPRILEAWREQKVVHALGDLAEAEVTARLRETLPRPARF